ncbi:MAG: hypothetical protein IPP76_01415 [Moraxellaceae bacterium]|nr:hypothetical protein [Moraxellaceae bacterium]
MAIPVYWLVLNKKGNSNQRERICLIHRFIRQFGRDNIKVYSQTVSLLAVNGGHG